MTLFFSFDRFERTLPEIGLQCEAPRRLIIEFVCFYNVFPKYLYVSITCFPNIEGTEACSATHLEHRVTVLQSRAMCRRHCVGSGASANFGRSMRTIHVGLPTF